MHHICHEIVQFTRDIFNYIKESFETDLEIDVLPVALSSKYFSAPKLTENVVISIVNNSDNE